ncbi:MAG: (2Fe-2S)-binding protein [Actinomycetes bacterium]
MSPDTPPDAGVTVSLTVNGSTTAITAAPDTPLLHVLRNHLGLAGPRFGCGVGLCGACFVLLEGKATPACDTPLWAVAGKSVVTVEGLSDGDALHPVQQAFLDEQAAQCAFCLSGVLVGAAGLLASNPQPSEEQVVEALDRNLCRCGVQRRMVRAVLKAAGQ